MLLKAEGVTKQFGGLRAVDGVDISLVPGRLYGFVGPNGSGKTTTINLITGLLPVTSGRMVFDGHDVTAMEPHQRAALGIARTFQNIRLFTGMTVLENVMVGAHARQTGSSLLSSWLRLPAERRGEAWNRGESMQVLERMGIAKFAGYQAGELSYGDQRRVEIARALASRPKLLFLDEPTAGMVDAEAFAIGDVCKELCRQGTTIVLVEHNMRLVMGICEEIYVLNLGRMIAQGPPDEVQQSPEVIVAYLGDEHA